MMIRETEHDMSAPKTLKVTLPTKMHLVLHQIKILSGQNISDTVEEALEAYFDKVQDDPTVEHGRLEGDPDPQPG